MLERFSLTPTTAALAVLGIIVIVVMLRVIFRQSKELDQKIEEYHKEGPPADPYSEYIKLMSEQDQPKKKRGDKD